MNATHPEDRLWFALYGLAHIADGLVILASFTFVNLGLAQKTSLQLARRRMMREK